MFEKIENTIFNLKKKNSPWGGQGFFVNFFGFFFYVWPSYGDVNTVVSDMSSFFFKYLIHCVP